MRRAREPRPSCDGFVTRCFEAFGHLRLEEELRHARHWAKLSPMKRRAFVLACLAGPAAAQDAWHALRSGNAIVLFRHATAPGVGDPPHFKLEDCATQRNLDEAGRAESRRIGELFRARGIKVGAVWTSQWCRTRETARLAFGGDAVRDEPAFNSFFGQVPTEGESQTSEARELLRRWKGPGVLVVVTHQVNITALTGANTLQGHGIVMRRDEKGALKVIGSIAP